MIRERNCAGRAFRCIDAFGNDVGAGVDECVSSAAIVERLEMHRYADIPWDEQIVGCSNAIKSGRYTGKDLAAAFNDRGAAYRVTGDFDHAIQDYNQAIKLNPNDATAFYYRGIANGMRGQSDRAIQDFSQAIKINPNHVGALYSRGLTYSNKGLWDRAIQDYDEAIKLSPN